MTTPKQIDQTIKKNLSKLRKPGVLTVRPGFEVAGHRLTGKPAIVATVHTKTKNVPAGQLLPSSLAGIPVDVREATAHQRLRAYDPAAAAVTQAYGRPEDKEPTWPLEREMPSGQPLAGASSSTTRALAAHAKSHTAIHAALAAHAAKKAIKYVPAPNAPLVPVQTKTTITAHASPDAGLATLEKFLLGTRESLVVGMYDFTSGRILSTFESALGGSKTLQMVLDNPAPNPTRDQTDTQTVDALDSQLGGRARIVRALVRSDALVSAWVFPYAYHIKVIVRDGTAFWLSSGNLNNSNQPDLTAPPQTEDRDWHVIIEDEKLAQIFSAYLTQDYTTAKAFQLPPSGTVAAAVEDAQAKLAAHASPPPAPALSRPAGKVPPKVFSNLSLTITPLLTPDTLPAQPTKGQYLTQIVTLIQSAQKKLYIQLQYIESSSGTGGYPTLLGEIAKRVAAGVDVRLIESEEYGEKWAEKMKAGGVDLTANIRLQPNVHNKGFVVDSRAVVVSSQNFSPAGILENRDAGVILESEDVAAYFEAIFLSDWTTKAKPFAPKVATPRASQGSKRSPKKVTKKSSRKNGR
jgi:hypothetical protein